MRLIDRRPQLDARQLVSRFLPPRRFENVRFDTYRPDPAHPSQQSAVQSLRGFASHIGSSAPKRRLWARSKPTDDEKHAVYIDGGFGVGKTHLLAAIWHDAPAPKAYVTFEELTAFVGFVGMSGALEALREYKLICIDEFELDDVGNTLLIVSLLRGLLTNTDMRLATTSNTLPDRLGEQRFSASEFKREIAAIASHFIEVPIDGPDYRVHSSALPLSQFDTATAAEVTHDDFNALIMHLRTLHPVQYAAMFDDIEGICIDGLREIGNQDDALLWVQFVDELYDAKLPVSITGVDVDAMFGAEYRNGGYRKKYGRAESRARAMQAESAGIF